MSNASLAIKYRPQTFAEVVGQDMVKTVLSLAAKEDKVAPAYLLSGTRGVGKTTIARIFAKALSCIQAPAAEPCNQCENCRRITQGSFVDVVEIDGASNRGIDDIRRLRDAVGYAPLEGRYKVIIIDEAHMLTKEAFNALLKTLEEPPQRVSFILATTEQHKFPITIVSRCQHFVFKQIPEQTLFEHLQKILDKEGSVYEPEALELIAKRAQGSVRDAMSLLGQALALSHEQSLGAAHARSVLGLAGRDAQKQLLDAIARQDLAQIHNLVRDLLSQGIDIGFFLREFSTLWRNLFLISQSSGKIINSLPLTQDEGEFLTSSVQYFSLTQIHAAWQMTLEAQRKILTSLEPSAGLELLLYNLALLPRLVPIRELHPDLPDLPAPSQVGKAGMDSHSFSLNQEEKCSVPKLPASPQRQTVPSRKEKKIPAQTAEADTSQDKLALTDNFLDYCRENGSFSHLLHQCNWQRQEKQIEILTNSKTQLEQLAAQMPDLEKMAAAWTGHKCKVTLLPPVEERLTEGEIKEKLADHPTIKALKNLFDARFA